MIHFTSDQHFGDDRLKLFSRPFLTSDEANKEIIHNYNWVVGPNDTVYHLGDVAVKPEQLELINKLNGKKILIKGNYDRQPDEEYLRYFSQVCDQTTCSITRDVNGAIETLALNLVHYPSKGVSNLFNIVGHIHGAWRVQKNMLNVGVDVCHFRPVSEEYIWFMYDAISKFYDEDVWAAYNSANTLNMHRGAKGSAAIGSLKKELLKG